MRTLRSPMAVVVIAVLIGAASGPVMAQDETDPEYTAITGTAVAGTRTAAPGITAAATVPQEVATGMAYRSSMETNDPRLSGIYESIQNYYGLAGGLTGGALRVGRGRLTNEGGSWLAEFEGFTEPGMSALQSTYYVMSFEGEDGYQGLSAMALWLPTDRVGRWDVEGVLFPGEMPPIPAMTELPSD